MKFFGLPVRVIKKGKTRGRRSKLEKQASSLFAEYMKKPEVKKAMEEAALDLMVYGVAMIRLPLNPERT